MKTKMKKIKATVLAAIMAAFGIAGLASTALLSYTTPAHASAPRDLYGSETKDWGSLADGAGASEDVTVYGAALGDTCLASMSVDTVDMLLICTVTAANTATARMQNETTGTVDLASGTLRITVLKSPQF